MNYFWGKVRQGKKRGRNLGFPTINIALYKKIPEGIYVSCTKIHNKKHPSLTFIGKAKTFGEKTYQAETYIFSFRKDVYNEWVSVTLLEKIRENKKFQSVEELLSQMKDDLEKARKYFGL